jgi:hypothetical protein
MTSPAHLHPGVEWKSNERPMTSAARLHSVRPVIEVVISVSGLGKHYGAYEAVAGVAPTSAAA